MAKNDTIVREVHLKAVNYAESVSKDGLWHKRTNMVIVCGMLAKEARSWRIDALTRDLELKNHLLLLSCTT